MYVRQTPRLCRGWLEYKQLAALSSISKFRIAVVVHGRAEELTHWCSAKYDPDSYVDAEETLRSLRFGGKLLTGLAMMTSLLKTSVSVESQSARCLSPIGVFCKHDLLTPEVGRRTNDQGPASIFPSVGLAEPSSKPAPSCSEPVHGSHVGLCWLLVEEYQEVIIDPMLLVE